jgi:GMP synthase-like glutamine amidotransferase
MKPIAVFRHSPTEGAGYLGTFLQEREVPWTMIKVDEGEAPPVDPRVYAGLVFMGGPMSVNDELPWIPPALELIRRAVRESVPVLGHCLGGQLMASALGAPVWRNPVKEIGWGRVSVPGEPAAQRWFGDTSEFLSFHWHGETFGIPAGAQRIASSEYCANQAFVLEGHLAMQCHVEMTVDLIRTWCRDWHSEVSSVAARGPSVQSPQEMQRDIEVRVARLNGVAARLYERWLDPLAP